MEVPLAYPRKMPNNLAEGLSPDQWAYEFTWTDRGQNLEDEAHAFLFGMVFGL